MFFCELYRTPAVGASVVILTVQVISYDNTITEPVLQINSVKKPFLKISQNSQGKTNKRSFFGKAVGARCSVPHLWSADSTRISFHWDFSNAYDSHQAAVFF